MRLSEHSGQRDQQDWPRDCSPLQPAWPTELAQIFSAALLIGKRQPELARGVLDLGRALTCPTCGSEYVASAPRD